MNSLTAAELKRRGMAAIEEGLRRGPVHLFKRNKPAAVVVSATEYARLTSRGAAKLPGMTAMQWLLAHKPAVSASKRLVDQQLRMERDSWK